MNRHFDVRAPRGRVAALVVLQVLGGTFD